MSRNINNMKFKIINVTNDNNFKVSLLNYGACIRGIFVDDKILNVTPNNLSGFINCDPMYGKTIGRYAGRIEDGKFTLNGNDYQLDLNNGGNCLHGGKDCIGNKIFDYNIKKENDRIVVEFTYFDKEKRFPGDVDFKIKYTIFKKKNDLLIDYYAKSNKDTILNLTNHTYFNLSGNCHKTVIDERMYINADKFTKLKNNMCLESIEDVLDVMDFRKEKTIGKDIENVFLQNHPTKGYDHCFILRDHNLNDVIASLYDDNTRIRLNVYTTYPCVVVYSCNYPSDRKILGNKYPKKYQGICFECQYMPNSINYGDETILRANEEYHEQTIFSFIKE